MRDLLNLPPYITHAVARLATTARLWVMSRIERRAALLHLSIRSRICA
jgi:hypothetical protein